ncbi:hypothetical protein CATYP_06045 [Corynebacterium atypicum]|uniref:Uncharacterized protein n=2 Tax=Corynebacterium atypicum TaxID=191610 RepID=A0ABM5QNF6_9CORY|nr:hypothetical protein CATYP_06045 [Corynebacterium atypicum]
MVEWTLWRAHQEEIAARKHEGPVSAVQQTRTPLTLSRYWLVPSAARLGIVTARSFLLTASSSPA